VIWIGHVGNGVFRRVCATASLDTSKITYFLDRAVIARSGLFIRTADELMMAQAYSMKTAVAVFIRKNPYTMIMVITKKGGMRHAIYRNN
jgi:hypothetical protein